jgi:signal transduction histidine kinase
VITQSAYDRVVRTLALSVGAGSLVFTLLGLPGILAQVPLLDPLYSAVTIAIYCGLPPLLAAASFRLPVGVIKGLAGTHAVASIIFVIAWLPAMKVPAIAEIPWLINTIAVATSEAAIAVPVLGSWIYLIVASLVSGVVRFLAYGGGDPTLAFQDTIMIALICGFMLALLQLTLVAGRSQDLAALRAQEAAATDAANQTLERQRTRYQAFTHDDVLATLLAAAHDGRQPSDVTLRSARNALEKMDKLGDEQPLYSLISYNDLDTHFRVAAASLDVPYSSDLSVGQADYLPIDVCDALTEALTEAMRNIIRHASWPDGREVARQAHAARIPGGVEVTVTDDGVGFNPRRVGLDRLGVRLSILERVNSQLGGHATIRSAKGTGTTVTLVWKAPVVDEI